MSESEFCPFDDDVLLKGLLVIRVTRRCNGEPLKGRRVVVRGPGFG